MIKVLWRSVLIGSVLFGLFVWAFGLPGNWDTWITIVFGIAVALVLGGALLMLAKWMLIGAVVSDLFGDDDKPRKDRS